jgi:hypothetical protein
MKICHSNIANTIKDFYHSNTIEEASQMAPALTIDKVIRKFAPANYQLDRMIFQFPIVYSNLSSIIAETPKSTLQAVMLLLAWKSYEPFLTVTAPMVSSPTCVVGRY